MEASSSNCHLRPVLLQGSSGDLVAFYHPPAPGTSPIGDILLAPAFAEEMNRCRSMVTLQSHEFAKLGIGTLVVDMRGTGDSWGEFEEADWEGWQDDLRSGIGWLRNHGNGCNTVWGIRLGALMAAQLALLDDGIRHLILWTPVVDGKTFWTQFLRIRIAADMGLADGIRTTNELRQRSLDGLSVEASGYVIGPKLALQLDQLSMPDGALLQGRKISWFEVTASADSPVVRANSRQLDEWRAKDLDIHYSQVLGPPFWHVHDRAVAPQLIDACFAVVDGWKLTTTAPKAIGLSVDPVEKFHVAQAPEFPIAFPCEGCELAGVIHRGAAGAKRGVVIVVAGGPQFRAGAHRQFVSLARRFAASGFPVLRFDLRGMGDSNGQHFGYEQSRPDIRAAIDELMRRQPSLKEVALFGECNSASGILFYVSEDDRVRQIALVNPWVRTSELQAEVILKHYYLDRLMSREFWLDVRQGRFKIGTSLISFIDVLGTYLRGLASRGTITATSDQAAIDKLPLPARTAEGLRRFSGSVLFLISGRDYIAREFDEVTKSSPSWRGLLDDRRVSRIDLANADHTFSKPEVKLEAQIAIVKWLRSTSDQ